MYDLCKCWMKWILNHQCGRKTGLRAWMLSHFSRVWLCDPVDSLPGSSVHDFPGKNTGVGCHSLLLGIFQSRSLMSSLLQADSLPLAPPGKPKDRVRAWQSSRHNIFINSSVYYVLWCVSLFTDILFNMYYWCINTELRADSFQLMSEWTWISHTCICFIGYSIAFLRSGTLGKI